MTTALHRLRLARGQSLRALAAEAQVSYETIRRVERGAAAVHPRTRKRLEEALGLPFDVLSAPVNENGGIRQDAAVVPRTTARKSQESR
jgi:transcriptional regulator with XRE-family HTH domain